MKKVISLVLTAVMLLSLTAGLDFSAYAFVDNGSIGPNANYSYNEPTKTLIISGYGPTTDFEYGFDAPFQDVQIDEIEIEYGITRIGSRLFYNCSATSVSIPDTVTSIGASAFTDCVNLESVTVPNGVSKILSNTFIGCTSLERASLPEGIQSIGRSAFEGCRSLSDVNIPSTVEWISDYAFDDCSSIESLTLPEGLNTIYYCTFDGCTSLKSINIPDSVTTIESRAFQNCSSLESLYIPENCDNIHNYAFNMCGGLKSIKVNSNNTSFDSRNGCNALINTSANRIIRGCKNTKIPSSVKTIGAYSFDYTKGLKSITIGSGVTTISECAFFSCHDLTSVELSSKVKTISNLAFADCTKLKNFTVSKNVKNIAVSAFNSDSKLASFYVNSKNKYFSAKNGVLFNKKKTRLCAYPPAKSGTKYTVPKSVKTIGAYAFCGNNKLTRIKLKKGVKTIRYSAFTECTKLNKFVIPSSVTSVGSYAFVGCTGLKEITIPKSINTLSYDTFNIEYSDDAAYTNYAIRTVNYKGSFKDLAKLKVVDDAGDGDPYVYGLNTCLSKANIFCTNGLIKNDCKCYESKAKITKQPTFKSTGRKVYKCSKCGKKITVTLPKLGKAKLSGIDKGKKSFTAKWSKVANVGGYQIQFSTNKSMKRASKVKIRSNKITKKTVKNLKGGTKYYVRIRAYKKINGKVKYSAWSAKKTVTTRK